MLDIFLLGTCRWSELIIYFGSFALLALKFEFFVGRLIANKRLPITDDCQKINKNVIEKSKTNQYTLAKAKGDLTKRRNENEKQTKKEKAKGN